MVCAAICVAAPTTVTNPMGCTCEVLTSDDDNDLMWQICDDAAALVDKRAVPADCNNVPMPLNCEERYDMGEPYWCCYF
jgi:hypothetical protein